MTPLVESQRFSPNTARTRAKCGALALRTQKLRAQTYEIERIARNGGEGTRARLNEALIKSTAIIDEVIKREDRFQKAMHNEHQASIPTRDERLDVVA